MIPLLEASRAAGAALVVPPPRFRGITGPLTGVSIKHRDYVRGTGFTDAQHIGLRYEAQVQSQLVKLFQEYVPEPELSFYDQGVRRSVRPDGILVRKNHLVIFEIKYTHVPEAWWQLEKLYKVVLDGLYHRPISLVEICRSYDPSTPFPCEVGMISDLETWVSEHRSTFGVYVWRRPTP